MNTSITDLLSFEGAYSDMYVAAPIDLDYDEPNAVVQELEVEFVSMASAIQAVELPVSNGAIVEVTVETKQATQPVEPAEHRIAA